MDLFTKEQRINICFVKNNALIEMSCIIESVHNDRLDVILPKYFMRYIDSLQVGMPMTVKTFSKYGIVNFASVVISSPLEEKFEIELDYNSLYLLTTDDCIAITDIRPLTVIIGENKYEISTSSLSANTLEFKADFVMKPGDYFNGILSLPEDYGIIEFKAVVTSSNDDYGLEYTANFSMISEKDRQTLLFYIYMYDNNYI